VTTHLKEKRAFTFMVGLSADGKLLPFQSIWGGKTNASLPTSRTDEYREAVELGFLFEISGIPSNYWSTEDILKSYVNNVLARGQFGCR
jgi:hypothetical protein